MSALTNDKPLAISLRKWLVNLSPLLGQGLARALIRFGYTVKLLQWIKDNPCVEFNGKGSYSNRDLFSHAITTQNLSGAIDYLEFGVAAGSSIAWWVANNPHPDSRFVGFDTFTGLPEDWYYAPKGAYSTQGKLPDIADGRCSFEVGLFQDTLGAFLAKNPLTRRKVIHIDSDLYSSSLYTLSTLASQLQPGDIIFFDDFGGLKNPVDDFRSLHDFAIAFRVAYVLIGAADYYRKIAIKITGKLPD